jgi:hypothetical protein
MILAYFHQNLPSIASIMKIKGMVNKIKTNCFWYVSSIDDKDEE